MLKRYDKWEVYRGETPATQVTIEGQQKVLNCSDCGWNHEQVSFLVDPYDGKYFVCQLSKNKVFYK